MSDNDTTSPPPAAPLHSNEATVFEYTMEGMTIPSDVTHVKVMTHHIPSEAFQQHESLTSVEIAQGVETIGSDALSQCFALKYVKIPPSIRSIGVRLFGCDNSLLQVTLPDSLQRIPNGCFAFCISLRSFRVPSQTTMIGHRAFWGCRRLMSIEIPVGVTRIGRGAFLECSALVNIALPPTVTQVGSGAFDECSELNKCLPDDGLRSITDLQDRTRFVAAVLKKRFEGLPLHHLCYYQSYKSISEVTRELHNVIRADVPFEMPVDSFQMIPLHLLVLSAKPRFELCEVFSSHTNALQFRDKTGASPMIYAMFNFAPNMVPIIKDLFRKMYAPHCDCLGLERWKDEIATALDSFDPCDEAPQRALKIKSCLKAIARNHTKEVLSCLELGIWRTKLVELYKTTAADKDSAILQQRPQKRARLSLHSCSNGYARDTKYLIDRVLCRTLCKADVIVQRVLPFIATLEFNGQSDDDE